MSAVESVLATLKLKAGGHTNFDDGACLLEAASYVAGEPWSDHPQCVSAVLGAYGRRLNDGLGDADRQKLIPFIPRLLNTAGDGQDEARRYLAVDWAVRVGTPRWLDAAGLTVRAAELRALAPIVDRASSDAASLVTREVRDEARAARAKVLEDLRARVRAELEKQGKPAADAVAVAVTVAAADAVAVAVAVTDAAAAAVAVAVAVAVTVTAAAAVTVAVAVAAAAADAVADAVAAAAAAAAADADYTYGSADYWKIRDAVYNAIYKTTKAGVESKFAEVIRLNNADGIALLERMIDPKLNVAVPA